MNRGKFQLLVLIKYDFTVFSNNINKQQENNIAKRKRVKKNIIASYIVRWVRISTSVKHHNGAEKRGILVE